MQSLCRERNQQTAGLSDSYADHRRHVMDRIAALTEGRRPGVQSLTLLGAGNCNDVDLRALTRLFERITLVDLDESAVESGIRRQAVAAAGFEAIRVAAPVDVAWPLSEWMSGSASESLCPDDCLNRLAAEDRNELCNLEPADVVVSLCLLSQIMEAAALVSSFRDEPWREQLRSALRIGHLQRMLKLLKPGGRALLVSDIVSSDTEPRLLRAAGHELPKLLKQCLTQGNFFAGLHPGVILRDVTTHPALASACSTPVMHPPWIWSMGPRAYAVYAISIIANDSQAASES
jgi:hypothetical protein